MALKRMAVWRIDANAVSFPRMMLLSRVQPKFKACAQAEGAGPSLSQGEYFSEAGLPAPWPFLLWSLQAELFLQNESNTEVP